MPVSFAFWGFPKILFKKSSSTRHFQFDSGFVFRFLQKVTATEVFCEDNGEVGPMSSDAFYIQQGRRPGMADSCWGFATLHRVKFW